MSLSLSILLAVVAFVVIVIISLWFDGFKTLENGKLPLAQSKAKKEPTAHLQFPKPNHALRRKILSGIERIMR